MASIIGRGAPDSGRVIESCVCVDAVGEFVRNLDRVEGTYSGRECRPVFSAGFWGDFGGAGSCGVGVGVGRMASAIRVGGGTSSFALLRNLA